MKEKEIVDYLIKITKEQNLFGKASIYLKKLLLEDKRIDIQEHIDDYLERENISHIDRDAFINEQIFIENISHSLVFNHHLFDCKNYPLINTYIKFYSSSTHQASIQIGSFKTLTSLKNTNFEDYDLVINRKGTATMKYKNSNIYREKPTILNSNHLDKIEESIINTFYEYSKKYNLVEQAFESYNELILDRNIGYDDYSEDDFLYIAKLNNEKIKIKLNSESAIFFIENNTELPLILETNLEMFTDSNILKYPHKNRKMQNYFYLIFFNGEFWDNWTSNSYEYVIENDS